MSVKGIFWGKYTFLLLNFELDENIDMNHVHMKMQPDARYLKPGNSRNTSEIGLCSPDSWTFKNKSSSLKAH